MMGLGNGWDQKRGACSSHTFKSRGDPGLCAFPSWLPALQRGFQNFLQKVELHRGPGPSLGNKGRWGVTTFLPGAETPSLSLCEAHQPLYLGVALSHHCTA